MDKTDWFFLKGDYLAAGNNCKNKQKISDISPLILIQIVKKQNYFFKTETLLKKPRQKFRSDLFLQTLTKIFADLPKTSEIRQINLAEIDFDKN